MNFNLTTIRHRGFFHASAFAEVKDSLAWALCSLGHTANLTENWVDANDRNIIFGCELLAPNQPQGFPEGTIIYNLEQSSQLSFHKVQSIALGSKSTLWDYSLRNVELHRKMGIDTRHVPIGYTPNLYKIPGSMKYDYDVLFLGWLTPRRLKIIDDLKAAGLRVFSSDKCYGGGRDNLISRSNVILNIHHDGRDMFEIVRCSYLMANYKKVISEVSADDDEYADLKNGLVIVPYEGIVDAVKSALPGIGKFDKVTTDLGYRAYHAIKSRDYIQTVHNALTELSPQQKVAERFARAKAEGDMKDYVEWIKDHAKGTCLEIGTRDGASTSALLSGVEANGGVLMSVDVAECGHLFTGHPQWKFIRSESCNPKLHYPELDIVLVDGDHTRAGYLADLERVFPLVKPGGLILSHDIAPDPSLTLEALPGSDRPSKFLRDEYFAFCERNNLRHEELPGNNGMGVIYIDAIQKSRQCEQEQEAVLSGTP